MPPEMLSIATTSRQLENAKKILLEAPNEATISCAVAPVLISIDSFILSPTYDAVPDASWKSPFLPTIDDTGGRLAMPKPVTVGYRHTNIKAYKAILNSTLFYACYLSTSIDFPILYS